MHTRMGFFSKGSHGRDNQGGGNCNRFPRRPRFSIHFDIDSQELGQLFQDGFFNWIGKGVVQPRPERPPFQAPQVPSFHVPPHVSLQPKVIENDGWQEIVHPTVSQHCGWPKLSLPAPLLINKIVQASPDHLPVQSSHERKRLKIEAHHAPDKGKSIASSSSPSNDYDKYVSSRMHLRDDFSYVINEIRHKGSTHPNENSEISKGDSSNKGKIASQSGKYGF
jgi:hypothetical protein